MTTAYYRCESCTDCEYRAQCCQAQDMNEPKELKLKRELWEKRAVSEANITTERGVYLRLCRSIQVEGAFALLKNDFGFRRFLTRGKRSVHTGCICCGVQREEVLDEARKRAAENASFLKFAFPEKV